MSEKELPLLGGIRILDLTRVVAGPFATALLADLGAEVIKVERPGTGDDYRYGPSPKGETSLSFQNTNRGKRSITLDIRQPEGREVLLRLAENADALVENFRAGFLDKHGLGAPVLQARNPRLVVASLSGFGQTGPRAGEGSYDIVAQAAGGLMGITGQEGGAPLRSGGALADFVGGLYLAVGLLAGLRDRDRTGRAQVLDLSNQDAIFAITDSAASIFASIGVPMEPVGNQHPFTAPYDAFPTTDGHVAIGSASNKLFRQLMLAIGRPELGSDERFRSHRGRASGRKEINAIVAGWVATRSCDEVLAALGPAAADVPCSRVASPHELLLDEQLTARGMIERHAHPTLGEVVFHGNPLRFSASSPRERALAPDLGQDNAAVFAELGLGAKELEELSEKKVI
ncbi:MAG: CoA transferase [bacterium]|nr:CoA transferase [bacterium]MCP5071583.1 CoA transferase [bacterium]